MLLNDLSVKKLPNGFVKYISFMNIGQTKPVITETIISPNILKVHLNFQLEEKVSQDDWMLNIVPSFTPEFHWSPHLTPTDNHIIAEHSFRSPAMIVKKEKKVLAIVPDLAIMKKGTPVKWYMDMNAEKNILSLGMSDYQVKEHVLFERLPGAYYPAGDVEVGFFLMVFEDEETALNPFRKVLSFLWKNWGEKLYQAGEPIKQVNFERYVDYTYRWAFETWGKSVWQEFELNGKTVGAPVFLVNVTQSPNYKGEVSEREFRSIWNQAWFSSLRSAQGLYRCGKAKNNQDYIRRALLQKELALSAPQINGIFPSVIATEMEELQIEGKSYRRSKGWETCFWGNSNRNPANLLGDVKYSPYHILDMSWTALLMLRWYEELEKDERLLSYATNYAEALLKLQNEKGFFYAWLDVDTLKPLEILNDSPETSMSVTFLLKLYELTNEEKYLNTALKALEAVCAEIVPTGRWEDFETYFSCSVYGNKYSSNHLINKKVERNNMYKQCNFSIFWTVEALYECYVITKNKNYLNLGQRCLDELLMTQASWQPPFIFINALGGFGVMNCDGEWNDARQSLFAEIIIKYGIELKQREYIERGFAALSASFVMMYCPENKRTQEQWEKKHPFFNELDYGFMMENYGHSGKTDMNGLGIGEFTIFDWGNGASVESYHRIKDHFGEEFFAKYFNHTNIN